MPRAAKIPCRQTGCRALLDRPGYCLAHAKSNRKIPTKNTDPDYQARNRFYQRAVWKKARTLHLNDEPLCRSCRKQGRLVKATTVDHIIPISQGGAELDDMNLQSLCTPCHSRKTLTETLGGGKGGLNL